MMLRLLLVPKGESQIDWKRNKNGRNQFCAAFRVRSFSGTSTALLLCMMQLQMLVMPALLLMGLSVHGLLIPLQQHPPPPAPPHSKRRHILLAMSGQEEAISASAADNDSSTGTLSLRKKTARIRNNNETTGTRSSSRQTTERIRNDGTPNTADAIGTTPVFQSPRTPPPPPSAVALQQSSTSSALLQPENGVKVSASSPSSSLLSEQLQQLKDSVDIVTAIESYQLDGFKRTGGGGGSGGGSRSRSGNNHNRAVAVCPFHDDHNPSLSIDSSRQIYKCFSCGAGGDVFRFVQEYSKLPGHGPELTFGQAVQHISTAFGDGRTSILGSAMSSSSKSSYSPARMEEQQRLQRKKDRMLLANAAAAAFFADCLTEPIAGGARYHLRSRQLSVLSIRAFAMGYAPDAYLFGAQKSRSKHNDWGEGSLVHHLRDLGFTPTEILDAGLATRTKKLSQPAGQKRTTNGAVSRETKDSTTDESATFADDPDTTNYSTLMDRFRARIMVPIFDASGSNILGFGGRVLPPPEMDVIEVVDGKMSDSNSNFKAPKYLNSPESQVFEKKNILFGQHVAQQTIREANSNSATTTTTSSALLVVEGYMDAIALWDAGIGNVVASMGTAVTAEQLELAAQTAGTRGGRIVLCLDNDTAGVTAMERLCKNGMLAECVTKHVVAIAVARLPDGVKDPAEFIESRKSSGADMTQVANDFRREVIDCAVDWTEWFIQRIIREYNREAPRGANGSFSDIFERIADFLASSLRPADRTKRAYEVAGLLSDILARERNTTEISGAVRIQLESDLIDLASRLSDAKGAIQRRIESVANGPSSTGTSASSALSALTRGHGPNSPDQVDKLSVGGRATIALESGKGSSRTGSAKRSHPEVPASPKASVRVQIKKPTRAKMTRQLDVESLTPHFSGFRFTHQFDSDWLGLSKSEKTKWKGQNNALLLGHRPLSASERRDAQRKGLDGGSASLNDNLTYFNSADFNGHQFLTDDAMNAGYASRTIKPDASLVENGIASLVEPDIAGLIESAEDSLLRVLVKQSPVRTTVKNMLDARSAVSFGGDIRWSCPAREWLFNRLVRNSDQLHDEKYHPSKLRSFLAQQPDAPPGAFSEVNANQDALKATQLNEAPESDSFQPLNSDVQNPSEIAAGVDVGESDMDMTIATDSILASKKATARSHQDLSTRGSLDIFFADEPTSDDAASDDAIVGARGDLAVQEILVTLLWASAAMKSKLIRNELALYSAQKKSTRTTGPHHDDSNLALQNRAVADAESKPSPSENVNSDDTENDTQHRANDTPLDTLELSMRSSDEALLGTTDEKLAAQLQLSSYEKELLSQLRDTTRTHQSLKESAKRITARLMDESSSTGIGEGHMSAALQADLASRLDDHVRDVCQVKINPEEGSFFQARNDEPYEEALERMAADWGEWFDDEYVWEPGGSSKSGQSVVASNVVDRNGSELERETLDEFFERIDREWEGWDDD